MKKNISKIYQAIKRDDVDALVNIINLSPEIIDYKTKENDNLLFYAIGKHSVNVAQYLFDNYPALVDHTDTIGDNILTNIIVKNDAVALKTLISAIGNNEEVKKRLHNIIDVFGNNMLMLAVSKCSSESWQIYKHNFSSLWNNELLNYHNSDGRNIAHIIGLEKTIPDNSLIDLLPMELFKTVDNLTGSTPFLLACRNSENIIVKKIAQYSNLHHTTLLKSSAVQLAASNPDIATLDFLLSAGCSITGNNSYNHSSLLTSIVEKKQLHAQRLLPYFVKENINNELLQAAKNCHKMPNLWKDICHQVEPSQLEKLNNKEEIAQFLSYIFYYTDENSFEAFLNSPLSALIMIIDDDRFLFNQLYLSTVSGRKIMHQKITCLLSFATPLFVEELEQHYNTSVENNDLFYQCKNSNSLFYRKQRNVSFAGILANLPSSQIKDILTNTSYLRHAHFDDLLLLKTIGIKKKNTDIIDFIELPISKQDINQNTYLEIDRNIRNFSFDNDYSQYLHTIFEHYDINKGMAINFLANNTMAQDDKLSSMNNTISIFKKNIEFKKLYIQHIGQKIFTVKNCDDIIPYFSKKKMFVDCFKYMIHNYPHEIVGGTALNNVPLENFTHDEIVYIVSQAALSNNIDVLSYFISSMNFSNEEDYINWKKIDKKNFSNQAWCFILNQVFTSAYKQDALMHYLDVQSQLPGDPRINDTIEKALGFASLSIDDISHLYIQSIKNNSCSYLVLGQYLCDNFHPNVQYGIVQDLVDLGEFNTVEEFISNNIVDINLLNFTAFFVSSEFNNTTKGLMTFTMNKKNKIDPYFSLIKNISNDMSSQQLNDITQTIITVFEDSIISYDIKLTIWETYFQSIENNIHKIDDNLLIQVCSQLLSNDKVCNEKEFHEVFSIIFRQHKDDSMFFKQMNDNTIIKENYDKIPAIERSILEYNFFNDDLSINIPLKKTKRVKI